MTSKKKTNNNLNNCDIKVNHFYMNFHKIKVVLRQKNLL